MLLDRIRSVPVVKNSQPDSVLWQKKGYDLRRLLSRNGMTSNQLELSRFYASVASAAPQALCFCLVHRGFCPVTNIFISLRKNTEKVSIKFAGGNHYHKTYEAVTFPGNSSSVDLRHGCLSVLMCRWRV